MVASLIFITYVFEMRKFPFAAFFAVGAWTWTPLPAQGVLRIDTVSAPSLRDNLFNDPAVRPVAVYLPPGYSSHPQRRYPVIYLLHGFGGGVDPFLRRINFPGAIDSLIRIHAIRGMIVVAPDGNNRLTGSFFRNSPVTGDWETFAVRDLIRYVDRNYRTLRNRKSRGIAGWSMGGYAALYLAVKHSDLFSAVYALSPCCLSPTLPYDSSWKVSGMTALKRVGSDSLKADFNADLVTALAEIYTPNPRRVPYFIDYPWVQTDTVFRVDSVLAERWRDTPLELLGRQPRKVLSRINFAFDAGDRDAFTDIPIQVERLHAILESRGILHFYEIFHGSHGDRIRERVNMQLLPFFSRVLKPYAP